ncbi:hypothetical protein ANOM_009533 [Aspergillus nomiae NRRL 13137]|uniref:DAPG hydrolase PhiG domain-containing protein n=1 Tax=Aspergillus nomiae NRRL (strain ATCC 15546 / NRRL 13137 / CBS 260.88 / M93) TaxID=1509407 RepID=A0A0L1ISN3_ASPN3|nr:uncharacterized protein ANOM_009533 [Aspergillus nomiae NRRL 13137]KNG82474.1 hypothetical protein ANOM_009533 [Aspergillus nomiae NRRL 13137]
MVPAQYLAMFLAVGASAQSNFGTPTSAVPTSSPTSLGTSMISTNKEAYQNDTSKYYLGYTKADFEKPFAKYWRPHVAPISDEVQKGVSSSPFAAALAYDAHEAGYYMSQPGYQEMENGYAVSLNGTVMLTARTEIPDINGEMYDWWFGWHLVESARYKLWNPVAHQYAWRYPNSLDWTNKTYAERYINTASFIDEYIGNDASKLTIAFIDPAKLGFDKSNWDAVGIETVVAAHIVTGAHVTSGFDNASYLVHQVRRLPDGSRELRSRFWLAKYTTEIAHDLIVHCNIEMQHLNTVLPAIFAEFKDTL